MKTLRPALVLFAALTALTGLFYPLLVTVLARTFFASQANGSLIIQDGKKIGSSLIGQSFSDARYFWGRPSATMPAYNAAASGGSNLGPSSADLQKTVAARRAVLQKANPSSTAPIPIDLVTTSASGLDPHISPAAALYQVPRVARARHWSETRLRQLVKQNIEGRTFGLLGEPHVNVLELNIALDKAN